MPIRDSRGRPVKVRRKAPRKQGKDKEQFGPWRTGLKKSTQRKETPKPKAGPPRPEPGAKPRLTPTQRRAHPKYAARLERKARRQHIQDLREIRDLERKLKRLVGPTPRRAKPLPGAPKGPSDPFGSFGAALQPGYVRRQRRPPLPKKRLTTSQYKQTLKSAVGGIYFQKQRLGEVPFYENPIEIAVGALTGGTSFALKGGLQGAGKAAVKGVAGAGGRAGSRAAATRTAQELVREAKRFQSSRKLKRAVRESRRARRSQAPTGVRRRVAARGAKKKRAGKRDLGRRLGSQRGAAGQKPIRTTLKAGTVAGLAGTKPGRRIAGGPYQAGKAFKEDKAVREETLRGLKALPSEFVQGLAMAATHPKKTVEGLKESYAHLYGPLLSGDSAEFRKRLGEAGSGGAIGPILDYGLIGGAAASRAALSAGKAGALGPNVKRISHSQRPDLRYGAGETAVKRQSSSKRLGKRLVQHRRDVARQKVHARRHEKQRKARTPDEQGHELGSLSPSQLAPKRQVVPRGGASVGGKVVPLPRRYRTAERLSRRSAARSKGRTRLGILLENAEARKAFDEATGDMSKPQQRGFVASLEGVIPAKASASQVRQAIKSRMREIRVERGKRVASGKPVALSKSRRGTNEELGELRALLDEVDSGAEIFTPKFQAAVRDMRRLETRIAGENPDLAIAAGGRISQGQMRRYKPQVETLVKRGALPAIEKVLGDKHPVVARIRQLEDELKDIGQAAKAKGKPRGKAYAKKKAQLENAKRSLFADETLGTYMNSIGLRKVITEARKRGLERPGYVRSEKRFAERFAEKTAGGSRGLAEDARYTGELFRTGTRDTRPQVFLQGLESSIKRKYSRNLVARLAEEHGIPVNALLREAEGELGTTTRGTASVAAKTEQAAKRAKAQAKRDTDLESGSPARVQAARENLQREGQVAQSRTVKELKDDLDELGITTRNVTFFNPGRVFRNFDEVPEGMGARIADDLDAPELAAAFDNATIRNLSDLKLRTKETGFVTEKGWIAVPDSVFNELAAAYKDTGMLGRSLDISKSQASRVLLGLGNTSWLAFQVGANTILTGMAGVGPFEFIRAQLWWKRLPEAQRKELKPLLNVQPNLLDVTKRSTGSQAGQWINRYRALKDTDAWQTLRKGSPGRVMDAAFGFDRAQTTLFRKAVFFNRAKREAFDRMGKEAQGIVKLQDQIMPRLFGSKKLDEQIGAVLKERKAIEAHAESVDRMLGDYLTYSAAERAGAQRYVMFYGFLRHSLQLTLYTMPTRSPILTGVFSKLALLSDKERREMLGVDDVPFRLGGLDFKFAGRHFQVNVARMSPAGNALFEAQSPSAVLGLLPPAITIPLQQATGQKLYSGKPLRVKGESGFDAALNRSFTPGSMRAIDHARVFFNQVEGLIPPLRMGRRIVQRGAQGDDAVLIFSAFGEGARPTRIPKTEPARGERMRSLARERSRSPFDLLAQQLLGVREIGPDEITQLQRYSGKKKARGAKTLQEEFQSYRQQKSNQKSLQDEFKSYRESLGAR